VSVPPVAHERFRMGVREAGLAQQVAHHFPRRVHGEGKFFLHHLLDRRRRKVNGQLVRSKKPERCELPLLEISIRYRRESGLEHFHMPE